MWSLSDANPTAVLNRVTVGVALLFTPLG